MVRLDDVGLAVVCVQVTYVHVPSREWVAHPFGGGVGEWVIAQVFSLSNP